MEYKIHPLANLLPMLTDEELQSLAKDLKQNGQRLPIIRWHGQIIDGRNRLKACAIAGIEPSIKDKDDALGDEEAVFEFIKSVNLERRHLTKSEMAVIGHELNKMYEILKKNQATNTVKDEDVDHEDDAEDTSDVPVDDVEADGDESHKPLRNKTKQVEVIAKKVGVSPAYVHEAERIERENPEKYSEVKAGKKTISQARKEIKEESGEEIDEEKAFERSTKLVEKLQEKIGEIGYKLVQTKIVKI